MQNMGLNDFASRIESTVYLVFVALTRTHCFLKDYASMKEVKIVEPGW